jgi:dTDP-4-dehydrorhamnose reductase
MLGRDLMAELQRQQIPVVGLTRDQCDVTKLTDCLRAVDEIAPRVVINCAAFTDVNGAESQQDMARLVNATGAENTARAAELAAATCIYISTDYVFDGTKPEPYEEDDVPLPINAYGKSKLGGELRTAAACSRWAVFRTSWLYGEFGRNFVTTVLRKARENEELRVVADQTGSPTCSFDLARVLVESIGKEPRGIFHATSTGACSWYEFAQAVFELSGVKPRGLEPVAAADFPTPACRPANSRLKDSRLAELGIAPLPHWKDALAAHLQRMAAARGLK